ncbi:MAG TPA: CPBP family intramembrane glutamic endopeptidase [Bryobacteraceae bacterium]|nr:CPBP family intramembrane glutamic endopeptidase [Bryobacteraceae bacterium]
MNPRVAAPVIAVGMPVVLVALALWYAGDRGVPRETAILLLPACLFEVAMYVLSGLQVVRERLEEMRPATLATVLTVTAPVSYLLYTVPADSPRPTAVAVLIILVLAASCWFPLLGRHAAADAGFLVLLAAPILLDVFGAVYPDVTPRVPMKMLGVVMWYRTGLISALVLRRMDGVGFGFVPLWSEWRIGLRNFALFLPGALILADALDFARRKQLVWDGRTLLIALVTFVGVLWVLAVAEEFFFRGLLQQLLERVLGTRNGGLILASMLFGAAHLGYREFPNWKFALLAALAGIFYGRAYLQARSIRASMVTHACVVTTWKTFLT